MAPLGREGPTDCIPGGDGCIVPAGPHELPPERRFPIEKHIMRWSYWLGILCVVLAVVARILNSLGLSTVLLQTKGDAISFRTFVDGSLLFLVTSIATAGFVWFKRQNN